MGIHHSSHTHPIHIPMGILIPTAALNSTLFCLVAELTRFSFWRSDQWASNNALQWAPVAYVRISQWPLKLAPLAHWSARQKLSRVSSVQLGRSYAPWESFVGRVQRWLLGLVACCVRSKSTRFRWIQRSDDDGATFSSDNSWSLTYVYIGDECDCSCAGHGRCSHGNCLSVHFRLIMLNDNTHAVIYSRPNYLRA